MPSRFNRVAALAIALCLSASCSDQSREEGSSPDISPSAAPGVAFTYAYEFGLPDNKIAAAQEAHAQACEKLGLARCRITGMNYSVNQDEQVAAELDLKLDPTIARQFGKSSQQSVEASDGDLISLSIGSSDEGQKISDASKQKSDVASQIAALQKELEAAKPGSEARAGLADRIQALRVEVAEKSQAVAASQAALASTPMSFHYYGRGSVPGFRGNPVHEAWQTFVGTVVRLVGFLLQRLAVLIPLALVAAAFIAVWRTRPMRFVRQWIRGSKESEA